MAVALVRRTTVCALFVALAATGACGGGGEGRQIDAGQDRPAGDVPITTSDSGPDKPSKGLGEQCATPSECSSTQCVEGVCCDQACGDACFTCKNPGTEGTCFPALPGTDPGDRCPTEDATSCGTTGVCDGTGACARYSGNAGVVCAAEACVGFMRTTTGTCDSAGGCSGASAQSCTPYQCAADAKTCRTSCMTDADCVSPNTCVNNSCGKKPLGGACGADAECNSAICAQGRCCSAACTGTCKSCAVAGSEGTCRNIPDGMDPLGQCADEGATTCGLDGQCNGAGACRKYAANTTCGMDSCSAGAEHPAPRCDATSTCAPGALRSCSPYVCGTTNCKTSCASSADCVAGFTCVGSVCTQLSNGMPCTSAAMCTSGYCEQGVCCNTGCAAACVACNLTGKVGTCSPVAAGTAPTPATQCTDMGSTTCGTDGKCNGAGACRSYAVGTACGAASCTGSTLSSPRSCDGAGACRPATTSSCTPYQCATTACKTSCTTTAADCTTGNTCVTMSCGKIPIGGTCSSGLNSDCASNFCVNNVCCNSACTGTCMSCSLTGSVGTCSPIATGDPPLVAAQCPMAASTTCGNDGTCNGAGACRKYAIGMSCAAASCTGATLTSSRACDGAGVCAAATMSPCGKYKCDAAGAGCRTTCTVDADCVAPNICNAGSCTLKPTGTACTMANECDSGFCAQGYCCNQACTGTCKSCAIAGSLGTCNNVANGTAPTPATQCATTVASTCGTDGMCNGMGACRFWATTTQCAAATCVGSTLTPQRTCDGAGVCRAVTTSQCDPYLCNTATPACRTTCTANTDCVTTNLCVTGSCGKLADGQACTLASDCAHNFCAQGVCCGTACTGTCASCALAGTMGTCTAVPAGQDPQNQCPDQGMATCGTDGSCNGSGVCRKYASGTTCVAAVCTGTTLTPAATCNTSNACITPANTSCAPYACGTGACKTTCSTNTDCAGAPYVCIGSTCTANTMLTVKLKATANTQWVYVTMQLTNNGTSAIPMADLTMRYWYTYDTTPVVTQADMCSYSQPAALCGSVTRNWVAVTPARTNADFYYLIGFAAAAGNLNAGATVEFQLGWHKNDWSNFTQTNDYSYNGAAGFTTTTNVTVYRVGASVYGTEPM
jgi:Cellulose binding domain